MRNSSDECVACVAASEEIPKAAPPQETRPFPHSRYPPRVHEFMSVRRNTKTIVELTVLGECSEAGSDMISDDRVQRSLRLMSDFPPAGPEEQKLPLNSETTTYPVTKVAKRRRLSNLQEPPTFTAKKKKVTGGATSTRQLVPATNWKSTRLSSSPSPSSEEPKSPPISKFRKVSASQLARPIIKYRPFRPSLLIKKLQAVQSQLMDNESVQISQQRRELAETVREIIDLISEDEVDVSDSEGISGLDGNDGNGGDTGSQISSKKITAYVPVENHAFGTYGQAHTVLRYDQPRK